MNCQATNKKSYKKNLQYHQLEKPILWYQEAGVVWEPDSRFRPTKEKNGFFREVFAGLEDNSPKITLSVGFWAPHFYKALVVPDAYPRQA